MCMDMTVEKKKGFYFQMFFCKSAIGKPSSNVYAYKIYCQNFFQHFLTFQNENVMITRCLCCQNDVI